MNKHRMVALCNDMRFYGDNLFSTRRKDERAYWQSKIDQCKGEMMQLVKQWIPNYNGTIEQFIITFSSQL